MTVTEISMILNIRAEFPSRNLSVKSLVYKGKEPAPCSNAAQKKTVKTQKIVNTTILSLTIGSYLGILNNSKTINDINAKIDAEATTLEEKEVLLSSMADSVVMPYLIMAIALIVLAIFVNKAPLPDLSLDEEEAIDDDGNAKTSILQFPHLILGVIALFFYVGV